jgi:phosphate/sulfate permease
MKIGYRICSTIVVIAAVVASGLCWIALEHNPQQEFYGSELGVNWMGIVVLWLAPFIGSLLAFSVLAFVLRWLIRVAKSKEGTR